MREWDILRMRKQCISKCILRQKFQSAHFIPYQQVVAKCCFHSFCKTIVETLCLDTEKLLQILKQCGIYYCPEQSRKDFWTWTLYSTLFNSYQSQLGIVEQKVKTMSSELTGTELIWKLPIEMEINMNRPRFLLIRFPKYTISWSNVRELCFYASSKMTSTAWGVWTAAK